MLVTRILLLLAVTFAFSSDADAQRFYRRRAMMRSVPTPSVVISPGGGISVQTPYYSFSRSPGMYGGTYYSNRYGWPGLSVTVPGGAPSKAPPQATGEFDPAPGSAQHSPTPALSYNLAPSFEPTSATRAGLEGELAMAHAGLNAKLDQFSGGKGWQKYFALSQDEVADPDKVEQVLRRMDSVAADPKFATVAELDEFERLHELLKVIAQTDAGQAPPEQGAEMLPPPAADPGAGQVPPPEPQPPAAAQPTAEPRPANTDDKREQSVLRDN